jgi:hypothetical protein
MTSDNDPDSGEQNMDQDDSDDDPFVSEESEPVSERKVASGTRKPSKKALEKAMNEVSTSGDEQKLQKQETHSKKQPFFPANKVAAGGALKEKKPKVTSVVGVKIDDNDNDDGSVGGDEDDNEGGDGKGSSAGGTAKRIYKKALKILKLKLYFENFFPTDAEKDALPFSCWMSAVTSMGEIDGGTAAALKLFYRFGYGDKVRTTHKHLSLNSSLHLSVQLDKRISSIRSMLVTKSIDCHDRYYPTTEKKSAALQDDRYVYPGDPVSSDYKQNGPTRQDLTL